MATYLKRTSKLFDLSVTCASAEVNLRDFICPVCRGILIEPVTLPCTHNLCLRCLKGTFEHNSLSCPLCRVRVGSWLRTATKSETLVNNALWQLIRTRFPNEVEGKQNGDEEDIELDSDFTSKKVILSAAGEIRREYEVQLQIAEEEMRRQRETERIANEVLIRKIQAEERQQIAQLEHDQLLAKNLAKKQLLNKEKSAVKYYRECKISGSAVATSHGQSKSEHIIPSVNHVSLMQLQGPSLHAEKIDFLSVKDIPEARKTNISMISKIRADRCIGVKSGVSSVCKESGNDETLLPIHNNITRTLKHQALAKYSNPNSSSFASEPSCSGTQIYGTQSKEELRVPKDVLSSTKKSLGVEVCMTTGEDDERIGSAESAGSHDSINQEIHHFKPIKPIARTALKMSHDGRPLDPKLIRVLPILKRVSNSVPKPPTPTCLRKSLGCSWSAFRGKAKLNLELRRIPVTSDTETDATTTSTLLLQSHQTLGKLMKPHVSDTARRLDLAPDISFDRNKNYAKSINRILNGTKVSKKLNLDETLEAVKANKPTKVQGSKYGATIKNKRQKSQCNDNRSHLNAKFEASSSIPENLEQSFEHVNVKNGCTIENIAERIKRRKVNRENVKIVKSEIEPCQRSTKRGLQINKIEIEDSEVAEGNFGSVHQKRKRKIGKSSKTKRQRICSSGQNVDSRSSEKVDPLIEATNESVQTRKEKGCKMAEKEAASSGVILLTPVYTNPSRNKSDENPAMNLESEERSLSKLNKNDDKETVANQRNHIDEQIIQEQKRMEGLIRQEKEDFALALRLQSQFNDMERIAGRTRGSRRAMENSNVLLNPSGIFKTGRLESVTHINEQVIMGQTSRSSKKRQRAQKHTKK